MDVTIEITDDGKRALRYLGYTKEDIRAEINRQCSDFFENAIKRAKQKYVKNITLFEINPEPLEKE